MTELNRLNQRLPGFLQPAPAPVPGAAPAPAAPAAFSLDLWDVSLDEVIAQARNALAHPAPAPVSPPAPPKAPAKPKPAPKPKQPAPAPRPAPKPAAPKPKPAPPPKPTPAPAPKPVPVGKAEPKTRIIQEQAYSQKKGSAPQKELEREKKRQSARRKVQPGFLVGGPSSDTKDKRKIQEIAPAAASEKAIKAQSFKKVNGVYRAPEVKNPNDPKGEFDPYAYQPTIVFDAKEDSFTVPVNYDGDGGSGNDLAHYEHGVIGGKQRLGGSFTVTKIGEYTVLTYGLNYVDNKFTNYHEGDSSTVSIYLKPDAKGKLEPAYVYNSYHYAGNLTAWKDIKKDADGHPILRVERGSHAMHAYGVDEKITDAGLVVRGDGQATLNGKALPNRITWDVMQKNVKNARYVDPAKNKGVWGRYFAGKPERSKPFHPSLFKKA